MKSVQEFETLLFHLETRILVDKTLLLIVTIRLTLVKVST